MGGSDSEIDEAGEVTAPLPKCSPGIGVPSFMLSKGVLCNLSNSSLPSLPSPWGGPDLYIVTLYIDPLVQCVLYIDHLVQYMLYIDHLVQYVLYIDHLVQYVLYIDHLVQYVLYVDCLQ